MKRWMLCTLSVLAFTFASGALAAKFDTVSPKLAKQKGCLSCHEGIEKFTDGAMMLTIEGMGKAYNARSVGGSVCESLVLYLY